MTPERLRLIRCVALEAVAAYAEKVAPYDEDRNEYPNWPSSSAIAVRQCVMQILVRWPLPR